MCRLRVAYLLLVLVFSVSATMAKEPSENESLNVLVAKLDAVLERLEQIELRLQMLKQVNGRPDSALIVPVVSPQSKPSTKRRFDSGIEKGMKIDELDMKEKQSILGEPRRRAERFEKSVSD